MTESNSQSNSKEVAASEVPAVAAGKDSKESQQQQSAEVEVEDEESVEGAETAGVKSVTLNGRSVSCRFAEFPKLSKVVRR